MQWNVAQKEIMPTDKPTAKCYPAEAQYDSWKVEAESRDISTSQFIVEMVEAGRKKFSVSVERDETADELRTQRNELHDELEAARERIQSLENQLYATERGDLLEYIKANPGAEFDELVQVMLSGTGRRVSQHLDEMLGEVIETDADLYFVKGERE